MRRNNKDLDTLLLLYRQQMHVIKAVVGIKKFIGKRLKREYDKLHDVERQIQELRTEYQTNSHDPDLLSVLMAD